MLDAAEYRSTHHSRRDARSRRHRVQRTDPLGSRGKPGLRGWIERPRPARHHPPSLLPDQYQAPPHAVESAPRLVLESYRGSVLLLLWPRNPAALYHRSHGGRDHRPLHRRVRWSLQREFCAWPDQAGYLRYRPIPDFFPAPGDRLVADSLGPITITDPPVLAKFPVSVDWGGGLDYNPPISVHIFDAPGLKTEQRFVMGSGVPRLRVRRDHLNTNEYQLLRSHFLQAQGQYASFPIDVWVGPQGMETWNVRYENPQISFDQLAGMLTSDPGLTLLAMPQTLAPYTSVQQVTRFPDSTFEAALTAETQHIFPLLTIQDQARTSGGVLINPPALVSNQRVTVDGKTYLPRLLTWSGLTQTLDEASDSVQFTLGNADGAFTSYANQVQLYRAAVQLSLFHAESGYLCYLWGGYATHWQLDTSGRFTLPCSNGTFELTLGYPTRVITRTCWKVYKGRFCPSTASFTTCPKDYQSCVDRGVPMSFGGVVVPQQAIRVKDSTTGVMGWGRSWMTSVTVSNDTIYQNVVPEVWTDTQMSIDAPIMGGRDENDYYAAIGMVSDGPIGAFDPNLAFQKLDNSPPHDIAHGGGWRGVVGNDPANTNDYVGISQYPWNTVPTGSTYSGGLAFAEIRRTDAAGLQLAPLTDHQMSISVAQGVSGWVWHAPGTRRWVPGLANTVWVAVNVYLRALGLRVNQGNASLIPPSTMEQYFDCNAAIQAAAICDLLVNKLIPNDGTQENQFPFRGIFKERKPLKDWLTEILNCCLGYWTFVNGKLWIGIRENAGVKDAFTRAHLKWKTLQIFPLKPQFNWLTVQFGDEEYGWQLNNLTHYDIDHACMVGTADSPQYLQSTMNLVGVSNLSQAARVAITRLREEVGGYIVRDGSGNITDNQLARARNFGFSTTVLALKNQVGDVISLTHPLLPTGFAKGRISSWTLNPDFSIDIQAVFVTDEMYDEDAGPKPVDVKPPPLPNERLASPIGLVWMPNYLGPMTDVSGNSLDPLYPDAKERTFQLWQDYIIARDGSWTPALYVSGYLTINQFVSVDAPRISSLSLASGGALGGGQIVYLGVTVRDTNQAPAAPSNLAAIYIPSTASNQQIHLTLMLPISGTYATWDLWAGNDRRSIAKQLTTSGALPATYDFSGPIHRNTEEMPDRAAKYIQVGVKQVVHSGVAGVAVTGVPAGNQLQANDFIGATDNWVGRMLSAIADASDGSAPLWNFTITAFNATTGTLTISPAMDAADPIQPGDVLIIRSTVQSLTNNGYTIGDPLWNNSVGKNQFGGNDPTWAGLDISAEKGNIARVIRGAGMGQFSTIADNDHTTITLDSPFVGVDTTSIIIVEEANWADVGTSSPVPVADSNQLVQVRIPVDNLANVVALVGAFLNDGDGHLSEESLAIFREIFIFGQPPSVRTSGPDPGPWQLEQTDSTVNVDTSANDVTLQCPPLAEYEGRTLLIFNMGSHQVIINAYTDGTNQETFFDGSTTLTITDQGGYVRITSAGNYTLSRFTRARHTRQPDLRIE